MNTKTKERGYIARAKRSDWGTPADLYHRLDQIFNFDFDPCPENPKFDGLEIEWRERNFCNPPYDRLARWIEKAHHEASDHGRLVVMLIPARTDTKAWHGYVMDATEIWFVKGRITFKGAEAGAPFPSAIVIFDGKRGLGNPRIRGWEQ